MVTIEIADNPNCPSMDLRVFHALAAACPVRQVRLEREPGHPAWYDVTGWTVAGVPCPAQMHKVDDSGEGVAFLLHGGDAGLRLRPADGGRPWSLDDPAQWGEPLLIVSDVVDLVPVAACVPTSSGVR
jgi:hypothetical protein